MTSSNFPSGSCHRWSLSLSSFCGSHEILLFRYLLMASAAEIHHSKATLPADFSQPVIEHWAVLRQDHSFETWDFSNRQFWPLDYHQLGWSFAETVLWFHRVWLSLFNSSFHSLFYCCNMYIAFRILILSDSHIKSLACLVSFHPVTGRPELTPYTNKMFIKVLVQMIQLATKRLCVCVFSKPTEFWKSSQIHTPISSISIWSQTRCLAVL
jgi:hypothetical protein